MCLTHVSPLQTLEWFRHEQHLLLVESGAGLRSGRSAGLRHLQNRCQIEMTHRQQASSIFPPLLLHRRKDQTCQRQFLKAPGKPFAHAPHPHPHPDPDPDPAPPPTINSILLSESRDCGIPKKSGNQAIALTLQRPQLFLPYSPLLGRVGSPKGRSRPQQVLSSEGCDAGTLLIIISASLLRFLFYTDAVLHESNLEQCQMAGAGEPKGSTRIISRRLAGRLSLPLLLGHL